MSDTILALLGFATLIAVIVLLLRNVTVPALAFVSVSTITAAILVATGAFTLDEMAGFIKEGVKRRPWYRDPVHLLGPVLRRYDRRRNVRQDHRRADEKRSATMLSALL